MKRYYFEPDDPFCGVDCIESIDGEWVKYEDVKEFIQLLIDVIKEEMFLSDERRY